MEIAADFIARRAVLVLIAAACLLLLATAVLWRLIVAYAPSVWRRGVAAWNVVRNTRLARRVGATPLLGRILTGTFTTARYLGVFAVLAFAFAIAAAAAFTEIVEEIGVGESLRQFDDALSSALTRHVSLETLRAFAAITHLGDRDFLIGLCVVVAVALLFYKRRLIAGAWIAATASGGLMNTILKGVFERTRPIHDHGLVTESSFSFPSGHASGSMLVYGLLAYLLVRYTPRSWHVPVALVAATLIVFVGSSRIILQVHYFSDVLAGYLSAAAWVALWIAGLEAVRWRETRSASAAADEARRDAAHDAV